MSECGCVRVSDYLIVSMLECESVGVFMFCFVFVVYMCCVCLLVFGKITTYKRAMLLRLHQRRDAPKQIGFAANMFKAAPT